MTHRDTLGNSDSHSHRKVHRLSTHMSSCLLTSRVFLDKHGGIFFQGVRGTPLIPQEPVSLKKTDSFCSAYLLPTWLALGLCPLERVGRQDKVLKGPMV